MKKLLSTFVFLIVTATIYSGVLLSFFHARSDGSSIILEWQTTQENNVKEFIIERSASENPFVEVDEVSPKGNDSFYSFTDQSAYKTNDVLYTYRLKIIDMDNSISYSNEISVAHNVSSVKRTWGSIKALFR